MTRVGVADRDVTLATCIPGSGTGSGKGDGKEHTQSPKSQTKVLGSISEGPTCPPQSPPAKDSLVFISNISSHLIRVGLRQLL